MPHTAYGASGSGDSLLSETEKFLAILAPDDTEFTYQTFPDAKVQKDKNLVRILHGSFAECKEELQSLNDRGAGIFITVNRTDLKGREAVNITGIRALFVDLDGAPLEPVLNAAVPPDMIVESSEERYHAYWLISNCPIDSFKSTQQALAKRFDGDRSCCDTPRVLRLPGFFHRKNPTKPFLTTIHSVKANNFDLL